MKWDNIPDELKQMRHWVCWKMGLRRGALAKVPHIAKTGKSASSTNPHTWASFDEAVIGAQRFDMLGIGFMFEGSGLVGIDVDDCRDPNTQAMTPEIQHIITTIDSYTEYSQSGKGLHVICRGHLPEGRRRNGPFEMYDSGRYFIMTGNILDDAHTTIEDRQPQLEEIHRLYVHEEKQKSPKRERIAEPVSLDDADLIRMAMAANNGAAFARLWNGDISGYTSHSEADLALCNMLAFWTGCDEPRIISLWRQSGMWREKCDEMHGARTYAAITAAKAAADTTTTYTPAQSGRQKREIQPPPGMEWPKEPVLDEIMPPDPDAPTAIATQPTQTTAIAVRDIYSSSHDMGRASRFAEMMTGWAVWCNNYDSWIIWDHKTWLKDPTLRVVAGAKQMAEKLVKESAEHHYRTKTRESEELMKKTMASRSERAIRSMINLAKDELAVTADIFDADPFLLNCETGIIDLKTGQQYPHDPRRYMTKMAHAGYTPGASFKMFGDFLDLITCGDKALRDYFQDICGMAAIGMVLHEGMCIFHGTGKNGKSTFLNCISQVFGDYAGTINPEMLINQRDGRQLTGGASVLGKRLIVAQELEEGKKLSSAALKKLSSTDPITERLLYENERTFIPTHTLIMATNHLPRVGSSDDGTWRRIMVVPFRACISDGMQIKNYANVIYQADRDAILAWIVEGAQRYIANDFKITVPYQVAESTRQYQNAEDWLGNYLEECCDIGNYSNPSGDLYGAYERWCENSNEHPRRARDFSAALESRGFSKRKTHTCIMWDGLKVNGAHSIDRMDSRYGGF